MKITKYINSYIRFENVICVYRNFSSLNKRAKYFVKLRIFLETNLVLFSYGCYIRLYFDRFPNDRDDRITTVMYHLYMFFSTVNTLAAFILSYYNSHFFKEFISNIDAVHKLYENNTTFQNIRKEQYRRCFIDLPLFAFGFVIMTGFFMYTVEFFDNLLLVVPFLIELSLELRYYYENVVFTELIKVIIAPLRFLNVSVGMAIEKMKSRCGEECEDELWGVRRELEKWGAASQHLVSASDRLCDSFGVQIALSFFSATIYNIIFIYQAVSNAVAQKPSSPAGIDVATITYSLISFVAMIYIAVRSGQRATRKADQLHKNVVVLHTLLVGIPGAEAGECARAAAGLARRQRAAPLRLQLLSLFTLQMALLAEILAIVANYTIVWLQFNHVV